MIDGIGAFPIEPLKGRFDGKTMVITGGTSGIGRATVIRAAAEGGNVVFGGRNLERGQQVLDEVKAVGGKAIFVPGDLRDIKNVKELYARAEKEFGEIHIAVNNAGIIGPANAIYEVDAPEFIEVIENNLYTMFYCCKEAFEYMDKTGKGGSIVNVASIAGRAGMPLGVAYCSSKHAVNGMTKAIAMDGAVKGIRCNSINPAGSSTPLNDATSDYYRAKFTKLAKEGVDVKEYTANTLGLAKVCPPLYKRPSVPEEQAAAILFLASNDSRHITGAIVATDGGFTAY
ncbi:MAG: SDR family oxidoreductase [Oscillospiraceae bacterium]